MGLIKGSASFICFTVEGNLPENSLDFIAKRISAYSFKDIDETYDEYSIGWVSLLNMFDSDFKYASYLVGDYVAMTLRIDERKVAPSILKKCVLKEIDRVRIERQVPRLNKATKMQIKESVKKELLRKSMPTTLTVDLCWNLTTSSLLFFSTNKKIHTVLEDFFKETFGLLVRQQIPYSIAEIFLDENQMKQLDLVPPAILI